MINRYRYVTQTDKYRDDRQTDRYRDDTQTNRYRDDRQTDRWRESKTKKRELHKALLSDPSSLLPQVVWLFDVRKH